ncbi:helix-turn-helix domain-containing protein [Paenibacillus sp. NPDC058174]|uniref:helix-turn-helix domain-containing protein n=1 Tax=Paenibacillus sp. NPDC058174 TaxID=3346366 RepID=UPI0036D79CAD
MLWKRFIVHRRSVMMTWLLSYLAILTVPVLISIFVYVQSQAILKSEIYRANNVLLKEVRETIDNQIQLAERLTTELTWNVRIRGYLYSNQYKTPDSLDNDLYGLHKTVQEMAIYQSLYPSFKTYYVYFRDQDLVLEPGVYRSSRLSYETVHEHQTISYPVWLNIMQSNNAGKFIKLENRDQSGSTLAYIQSFPGNRQEPPPGTAVVLLDTGRLMEVIQNVSEYSSGQVMLLNPDGQILLSTQQTDGPGFLPGPELAGDSGTSFTEVNGQRSEFLYIKSQNSELIYATVIPSNLFWNKTDYLRKITYLGLGISVIGGLVLALVFLYRNYSPVRSLLRMLKHSQGKTANADNEFLYIQQAISDTLNEQEKTQFKMKQQSNLLRSNMLSRLFKGRMEHQIGLDESLSAFDVHFLSDQFAVLLFHVDYERFSMHLDELPGIHDKSRLMQFIVTNIVEDMAGAAHRGYVSEIDDHIACLISLNEGETERHKQEIRELAEQAREFLGQHFNIQSEISISRIQRSIEGIALAYREALDTMEYMMVVGQPGILMIDDIARNPESGLQYTYPIQLEQQLINVIKSGDGDKTKAMIHAIITDSMEQQLTPDLLKCLMLNLISTLVRIIAEVGSNEEVLPVNSPDWIAHIMAGESIKEMEQRLLIIVSDVCAYTADKQKQLQQSSRNRTLQQLSAEIKSYLGEHYQDPNLNIAMIGERFGLTPTYLSRLFKEQTGSGLLDTLNLLRLEQAKQLLRDSDNSIKSIAGQVGFHDINTFIRIFKKYESMTPGQYQKMI